MFRKFYFNLDLESFSEQVFSENCRRVPLLNFVYNMEPVQACIALNVISITLNLILKLISNQCNGRSTGGVFIINLAAIF